MFSGHRHPTTCVHCCRIHDGRPVDDVSRRRPGLGREISISKKYLQSMRNVHFSRQIKMAMGWIHQVAIYCLVVLLRDSR